MGEKFALFEDPDDPLGFSRVNEDVSRKSRKRAKKIHEHGRTVVSQETDEAMLAPMTNDFEVWRNNKDKVDFPGIDTPPDVDTKTIDF